MNLKDLFKTQESTLRIVLILLTLPAIHPIALIMLYGLIPFMVFWKITYIFIGGIHTILAIINLIFLFVAGYLIFKFLNKLEINKKFFWLYWIWIFYLSIVGFGWIHAVFLRFL